MKSYTFEKIHCNDCGERLEKKLRNLEGGDDAHIDYEHLEIHIPEQVSDDEIRKIFIQEKIMTFPKSLEDNKKDHSHDNFKGHSHKGHSHSHDHGASIDFNSGDQAVKNIKVVFFINLAFSLIEVIFGLLFNSVAILSDAVHDFGDSVSVGLAWFFQKISRKEANNDYSFGHQRFSLMGALITAIVLLVGSLLILTQSIPRIFNPEEVNSEGMFILSLFAIAANGYAAWLLSKGKSKNETVLNLHMLEDVLGWVGVLVMSIVVQFTDWYILDPILSVALSLFIFSKTVPHFISTIKIFLEAVPEGIHVHELEKKILALDDVHAVTHLHIWSIDGEENAMNVTLFVSTDEAKRIELIKEEVRHLTKGLRVAHSTIEITPDLNQSIIHD